MIVHFCILLPVTGSSIVYDRNAYPMPDPQKVQGTSKEEKIFKVVKRGEKEKNPEAKGT
ncbi:hypothetical protein [Methanosarcina horonobensis]|uniref:hypothetical protein n=1 Tax=Methanosarcina horonobensis TaxID=418008 RepID=UPI000A84C809|nr:hypothetical protein [Methanosarcina horonobensis]